VGIRASTSFSGDPRHAARISYDYFAKADPNLFMSRGAQWLTKLLVRQRAELPQDRGPAAFGRRVGFPLIAGMALITFPLLWRLGPSNTTFLLVAGGYCIWLAARIAIKKLSRVAQNRRQMLKGLGSLYANPVDYEVIDLSDDETPSVIKCVEELEALGATHVCDLRPRLSMGLDSGVRVYVCGDATFTIAILRKTEKLLLFPAKPFLVVTTRFQDGRQHFTKNRLRARKCTRRGVTGRCLLMPGGVQEVLALHRKHVDRMIAGGAVPEAPPSTAAQVLEMRRKEHAEACEAWQRRPYSWGDALHAAFKVCRREFRDR
jgi:hypothetical protein